MVIIQKVYNKIKLYLALSVYAVNKIFMRLILITRSMDRQGDIEDQIDGLWRHILGKGLLMVK